MPKSPTLNWKRLVSSILPLTLAGTVFAATPPVAAPQMVRDTFFGTVVEDPYRWLEDVNSPETVAFMKAHADFARATLDAIPGRNELLAQITKLDETTPALIRSIRRVPGGAIFYLKRNATANQFKLYMRPRLDAPERLLIDPDALSKAAGTPQAINYFAPSNNGKLLAYGLSAGGSENASIYVIDVANGKQVAGPISRVQYSNISWLPDDTGFFFQRQQVMAPGMPETARYQKSRAMLFRLGTDVDDAPVMLGWESTDAKVDPVMEYPYVGWIVGTKLVYGYIRRGTDREATMLVAPLNSALAGKPAWRQVYDRSDSIVGTALSGDRLYLLSHRNAPRRQLLQTSLAKPDIGGAKVVVREGRGVITGVDAAADGVYFTRRDGTVTQLFRMTAGNAPAQVPLPALGSVFMMSADSRIPGIFASVQSWTQPSQIYRIEGSTIANTGLQPLGDFGDLARYEAKEVLVTSHDGAQVPLSILSRKGTKLDGNNPTLLYGYASYGMTEEPFFSAWRLAWLDRGGVFAIANPRGSGAFGQDWYKGGYQGTKPNTWKDFIACAEYLIAQRWTQPSRLAIWGGSAGGILVGRAMTERPDLFAAVVPSVGVLDAVRAETTANGVPNIPEFGTVANEPGFRALLAMSTYHQIRPGTKYPAVLLTHGVNDPRVNVWHSTKAAAALSAASTSGAPVLVRLDYESGHGIGSTKAQRNEERADILAFLLWQFGATSLPARP